MHVGRVSALSDSCCQVYISRWLHTVLWRCCPHHLFRRYLVSFVISSSSALFTFLLCTAAPRRVACTGLQLITRSPPTAHPHSYIARDQAHIVCDCSLVVRFFEACFQHAFGYAFAPSLRPRQCNTHSVLCTHSPGSAEGCSLLRTSRTRSPVISYFSLFETQKIVQNIRNLSISTGTTDASNAGCEASIRVHQRLLCGNLGQRHGNPGAGAAAGGDVGVCDPAHPHQRHRGLPQAHALHRHAPRGHRHARRLGALRSLLFFSSSARSFCILLIVVAGPQIVVAAGLNCWVSGVHLLGI